MSVRKLNYSFLCRLDRRTRGAWKKEIPAAAVRDVSSKEVHLVSLDASSLEGICLWLLTPPRLSTGEEIVFSRAVELSGRRARSTVEKPEGYKYKDRGG